MRRYHLDVHIEDGFARTTIDQTYFNHEIWRMEGTFYFPLPPDASLSRLAMYVDGKLMEGGMAEREHARQVFETIVRRQKDPALLEWIDGSTFRMRVFPLEGRQEKRIVLSYTQQLPRLGDHVQYRFPGGHSMSKVDRWSCHIRALGAAACRWEADAYSFQAANDGEDLTLDAAPENVTPDRNVVIDLYDAAREEGPGSARSPAAPDAQFASADHEGCRYLGLRYRFRQAAANTACGRNQSRLGLCPDPVGTESQPTNTLKEPTRCVLSRSSNPEGWKWSNSKLPRPALTKRWSRRIWRRSVMRPTASWCRGIFPESTSTP
jgi:hypothetical protein